MHYYEVMVNMTFKKEDWDDVDYTNALKNKCEEVSQTDKLTIFFYKFRNKDKKTRVEFCVIARNKENVEALAKSVLKKCDATITDMRVREIPLGVIAQRRNWANCNNYIDDSGELFDKFNLWPIMGHDQIFADEKIVVARAKEDILKDAEDSFVRETFLEELNRIYIGKPQNTFRGNPVQYILRTDEKGIDKWLVSALLAMGRLDCPRETVISVNLGARSIIPKCSIEALYKTCYGAAVFVEFDGNLGIGESDLLTKEYEELKNFCEVAREYQRDVLTIFGLPKNAEYLKKRVCELMEGCALVEICEDYVDYEKAVCYLKQLVRKNHMRANRELFSNLQPDRVYYLKELNQMFKEWEQGKICSLFGQYKEFVTKRKPIMKVETRGSAYDELMEMIGIAGAKEVICSAIDGYKAQVLFRSKGIAADKAARHMIFTGNPGTAKTTVARLFARIMRENKILSSGHMVEVGRADLVGKYVGHTAPNIISKFEKAQGGVLFIDEAYSLVDDRDGSFGDEAITTIVQEMENNREDVIVIFAGYPDKMEEFLKKNPGLRSRIAHHVHFDDYSVEELCEIAELIAQKKGVKLSEGARENLKTVMASASKQPEFGNGRFVRNVLEKAMQKQNGRLLQMDYDCVTEEDVKTLLAEDIDLPKEQPMKAVRRFGFAV